MDTFGIGYEAARGHLVTTGCLPFGERLASVSTQPAAPLQDADPRPLPPAPPRSWLRDGELARLCDEALRAGSISNNRAEELLRGPLGSALPWQRHRFDPRGYSSSYRGNAEHTIG